MCPLLPKHPQASSDSFNSLLATSLGSIQLPGPLIPLWVLSATSLVPLSYQSGLSQLPFWTCYHATSMSILVWVLSATSLVTLAHSHPFLWALSATLFDPLGYLFVPFYRCLLWPSQHFHQISVLYLYCSFNFIWPSLTISCPLSQTVTHKVDIVYTLCSGPSQISVPPLSYHWPLSPSLYYLYTLSQSSLSSDPIFFSRTPRAIWPK